MRILLITPENRFIKAFRRGQLNNFTQLTMPYLAGFVHLPHRVDLVDEYHQSVDFDAPADLVGITCNTPNASHVYHLADAFRRPGTAHPLRLSACALAQSMKSVLSLCSFCLRPSVS